MMQYHYYDNVSERAIISDTPIMSNGVTLRGIVNAPDIDAGDETTRRLADLPLLIGKQQRQLVGADGEQMWRYYNNAQVARLVLAGMASARVLAAFDGMLAANRLDDPDYYGAMDIADFARFVLGLEEDFMILGLQLETEFIKMRRSLKLQNGD